MEPLTRNQRLVLGAVLAVGAVLRIAWSAYAARPPVGLHDPFFYRFYGEQLANGNGYRLLDGQPTAYYPPGYPLALGALFWVLFHTPAPDGIGTGVVVAFNIACQLVAIVATFAVARRITGRVAAGLVAAAVLAVWPNLVFHSAVALTESLFLALLMAALWLAVDGPWRAQTSIPIPRLAALGVLLGAATLVRPVSLPVFPALLAAWIGAGVGWRRATAWTGVVVAAAVAVVTPWAVRNVIVMDQLTLSTNTGDNLCMSRRVGGSGTFELPNPRCFEGPFDDLERSEFEIARDAHGREQAIEFVREHPVEELRLIGRRLAHTFEHDNDGLGAAESYGADPFLHDGLRRTLQRVANGYALAVTAVAMPGLVLLARRHGPRGLLLLLTGTGLLIPPLVFFGDARFHVPAVPVVAVAVGALVAEILRRRQPVVDGVRAGWRPAEPVG